MRDSLCEAKLRQMDTYEKAIRTLKLERDNAVQVTRDLYSENTALKTRVRELEDEIHSIEKAVLR